MQYVFHSLSIANSLLGEFARKYSPLAYLLYIKLTLSRNYNTVVRLILIFYPYYFIFFKLHYSC